MSMEIKSQFEHKGQIYNVHYIEEEPTTNLEEGKKVGGVHCLSFFGDKMVIVNNKKGMWTPPGGMIEVGETYLEAGVREIQEESNMKVLYQEYIGYQDVAWSGRQERQARTFAIVEPFGEFVSDPDEDILEIKLIDLSEFNTYCKWGEVGDRLVERALELKKEYDARTHLG